MYKTTIQQIILFIISSIVIFKTGKYMVQLNNIKSFSDMFIVLLFFITLVLGINYFMKLMSKIF